MPPPSDCELTSSTANVEKKREEPPSSPKDRSPLAIIGMSGRYPMANNLAEFWQNLVTGRDCVSEIPLDRPGWSQYAKVARDRLGEDGYPRWGGFVDGYDAFEPGFFNISPLEARFLDPQERLFIEAAWECVEDAGHTPDDITSENLADNRTRVGVFRDDIQQLSDVRRFPIGARRVDPCQLAELFSCEPRFVHHESGRTEHHR